MSQLLRYKFWILSGLIVIAAVAAYLFFYRGLASQNEQALQQIQSGRSSIQSVQRQTIAGQGWPEAVEAVKSNYQEQKQVVEHLMTRGTPNVVIGEVTGWREFCLKLAGQADASPVVTRLSALMVDTVQERIQRKGRAIREARTEDDVGLATGRNYPTVEPALKMSIVREINNILSRADFYQEDTWADVPLMSGDEQDLRAIAASLVAGEQEPETDAERAAREQAIEAKIVELDHKRDRIESMLDRAETLSEKDVRWLNRLLIEAALPEHVADSSIREKFQAPFQYVTVPQSDLYQYTGLWKAIYATRVQQVRGIMEENFLGYGENCLDAANYTENYVPTETEMQWQEQAYWIQRYVVDALAGLNHVPQVTAVMTEEEKLSVHRRRMEEDLYVVPLVRSIRFVGQPERLLHYSHSDSYRPLAIDVKLIMRSRYLTLLQNALVEHVPTLEVTSFRANRFGQVPQVFGAFTSPGPGSRVERDRPTFPRPGLMPGEERDRPAREAPDIPLQRTVSGFRVYPFGEETVPEGAGFRLQGKLVEVVIRCYLKEAAPAPEVFEPETEAMVTEEER